MKRLIPFIIIAFAFSNAKAQDQMDALRYTLNFPGGTARSVAMGGAFGALGGDFYSASQNPAGLGVYRSSEFTITPEFYYNDITSTYRGNSEKDFKFNFNLNNLGYVAAFNKNDEGFIGGAFAIGYNKISNFNTNIRIEGLNTTSSLGQSFVESANYGDGNGPIGLDYLEPFTEGLFFDTWVMDYDSALGRYYLNPDMLIGGNANSLQRNTISRSGKMNEWVFSLGFNYNHFFYFGGTFSIIPVEFYETSTFSEYDGDDQNYEYFRLYESLAIEGTGYTGKFGIIIRPVSALRLGIAAHLPTIYNLYEERDANMRSAYVTDIHFPIDEHGNQIDAGTYDYQIITPAKFIGSVGLSIAKMLILSTDIEYIDYASMRLRNGGDGYDFSTENDVISDTYSKTFNAKAGAEVRLDNLYLRGGFGYYGSPYQKDEPNYDAYKLNYSGGFGLRNEHAFIDFTVSYLSNNEKFMLYSVNAEPNGVASDLKTGTIRTLITCGFKF